MKKFFGIGLLALLTTAYLTSSCSRDEFSGSMIDAKKATFNDNFIAEYGNIAPNHDWGFGTSNGTRAFTRSGNTSGSYTPWPSTHQYYDANGNLIASANMNHNQWGSTDLQSMPYGGWIVPDPLTEGQKLRVQKYFQANPNLSYEDPRYANFYVQQVYTGGTDAPTTGNHETTVAANGQGHQGMTLNQLTVGQAASHINDFNAGTCTTSQVLNHEGKTQSDQITLMLNVDDTSCFGFHETSGSNVNSNENSDVYNHNDKMALVSAAVIDAWAAQNGNPGEAVVDKWNRSFMGFDYELLPESDIVTDSYALLSQVPNLNNILYAWDGTKVMTIGAAPETPEASQAETLDITSIFAQNPTGLQNVTCSYDSNGNIVCEFGGQYYNSITFAQNADWTSYDKIVIEFAEASPIDATFTNRDGVDAQIKVGDTKVEIVTPNYKYNGNGPNISNNGIGSANSLTLKIKKVTLVKEATTPVVDNSIVYYNPTYLLGDADNQKISFYSRNTNMYGGIVRNVSEDEMKTTKDGKTCLDLTFFQGLVNEGYHPITTELKTWVKWQAACDGYYSDWIVTLTEATRGTTPPPPSGFICRIVAEDLTVGENSDFDFNDVVFDVIDGGKTLRLRAAGGELPLYVAGQEVHDAFATKYSGITRTTLINTGWNGSVDYENYYVDIPSGGTYSTRALAESIPIVVHKNGQEITLRAVKAKVASKVAVGSDFEWCAEREDIDKKFRKKDYTKLFQQYVIGKLGDDWDSGTAWYQYRGQ